MLSSLGAFPDCCCRTKSQNRKQWSGAYSSFTGLEGEVFKKKFKKLLAARNCGASIKRKRNGREGSPVPPPPPHLPCNLPTGHLPNSQMHIFVARVWEAKQTQSPPLGGGTNFPLLDWQLDLATLQWRNLPVTTITRWSRSASTGINRGAIPHPQISHDKRGTSLLWDSPQNS